MAGLLRRITLLTSNYGPIGYPLNSVQSDVAQTDIHDQFHTMRVLFPRQTVLLQLLIR
jgi:hypothetical protein